MTCRIVGPYLPEGETEWRCTLHGVDARLKPGIERGRKTYRREDFECPAGVYEQAQWGWGNLGLVDR